MPEIVNVRGGLPSSTSTRSPTLKYERHPQHDRQTGERQTQLAGEQAADRDLPHPYFPSFIICSSTESAVGETSSTLELDVDAVQRTDYGIPLSVALRQFDGAGRRRC
jgi:hypothetical protein